MDSESSLLLSELAVRWHDLYRCNSIKAAAQMIIKGDSNCKTSSKTKTHICVLQIKCKSERWNIHLFFQRSIKQEESRTERDSSGDATEKPPAMSNCVVSEKELKQNIPCAWNQCLKLKYCVLMYFQSKSEGRGENINKWLEKRNMCRLLLNVIKEVSREVHLSLLFMFMQIKQTS